MSDKKDLCALFFGFTYLANAILEGKDNSYRTARERILDSMHDAIEMVEEFERRYGESDSSIEERSLGDPCEAGVSDPCDDKIRPNSTEGGQED